MQDDPSAELIVGEVRKALDAGALAPGFPQKVAANALGIAAREMFDAPASAAAEAARLADIVGTEGDLAARNARLAEQIRHGDLPPGEAVIGHLIATTVEKLEVDQPAYPAFRMWRSGGDAA